MVGDWDSLQCQNSKIYGLPLRFLAQEQQHWARKHALPVVVVAKLQGMRQPYNTSKLAPGMASWIFRDTAVGHDHQCGTCVQNSTASCFIVVLDLLTIDRDITHGHFPKRLLFHWNVVGKRAIGIVVIDAAKHLLTIKPIFGHLIFTRAYFRHQVQSYHFTLLIMVVGYRPAKPKTNHRLLDFTLTM